ncbi:GNAT family N-acetyltransferase [Acidisoma silvae]|uniref:GNAT family N-acetyltransferase n=1 Tax=Acidisoma silvae TaxID=2802396 RepID=A0A964E230_9PROT|nr:GNAT family N-acetyltransferase [Acidisoma silvae]MCB8878403.1 GNAT family N-acetyltransferase [Acidisoma silvae]
METGPAPQLPTFKTARLELRPRSVLDYQACVAMDRDPLVTQFIPGPWRNPVAHAAFVTARIHHAYPHGMGYWCVFTPAGFIGWILLAPEDLLGPEIEIGWRLVRSAWGQGFATEAARSVLDHALRTLRLKRIIADIDPANTASLGVATKLGFLPAGSVQYEAWTMTRTMIETA